jgi:xeroderma pigmentosum group C-complementing protein
MRVCKRLQIDYAEAVVDFEFGHRMAVPVIQGVVIAEEYHDQVMEELEKDEAERKRKEDEKRRKTVLSQWRKFLFGLRVVKRIQEEYGHIDESVSVFGRGKGAAHASKEHAKPHDEEMAGGFLPEGYEEDHEEEAASHHTSSFFPAVDEDEADNDGGLIMEDHREEIPVDKKEPSPDTAQQMVEETKTSKPKPKKKATPVRRQPARGRPARGRRKVVSDDDEEEDDEVEDWSEASYNDE